MLQSFGSTHIGRVRPANEDRFLLSPRQGLWAVADGMGGHSGGAEASRLAMQAVQEYWSALDGFIDPSLNLPRAVQHANSAVFEAAAISVAHSRMGTTLTMFHEADGQYTAAHVGDSRLYLLRAGRLEQLSRDQTRAQRLIAAGSLSADEARTTTARHALTAWLGRDVTCRPDLITGTVEPGDRFLLSSDGLNEIGPQGIAAILREHRGDEAVRLLIESALEAGGRDNVTVILLEA